MFTLEKRSEGNWTLKKLRTINWLTKILLLINLSVNWLIFWWRVACVFWCCITFEDAVFLTCSWSSWRLRCCGRRGESAADVGLIRLDSVRSNSWDVPEGVRVSRGRIELHSFSFLQSVGLSLGWCNSFNAPVSVCISKGRVRTNSLNPPPGGGLSLWSDRINSWDCLPRLGPHLRGATAPGLLESVCLYFGRLQPNIWYLVDSCARSRCESDGVWLHDSCMKKEADYIFDCHYLTLWLWFLDHTHIAVNQKSVWCLRGSNVKYVK